MPDQNAQEPQKTAQFFAANHPYPVPIIPASQINIKNASASAPWLCILSNIIS
jgi:hypothetical protein